MRAGKVWDRELGENEWRKRRESAGRESRRSDGKCGRIRGCEVRNIKWRRSRVSGMKCGEMRRVEEGKAKGKMGGCRAVIGEGRTNLGKLEEGLEVIRGNEERRPRRSKK